MILIYLTSNRKFDIDETKKNLQIRSETTGQTFIPKKKKEKIEGNAYARMYKQTNQTSGFASFGLIPRI